MLYTDALFLSLFFLFALVFKVLRRLPATREALAILFSAAIIASWGLLSLWLFLAVALVNYAAALAIARVGHAAGRGILIVAITADISILAAFKYSDFLLGNAGWLLDTTFPKFALGIPLAISFYTFHIISYLVDLHARRIQNVRLGKYLFYLSFFPHVIAGPILRAWQFTEQIGRVRERRGDFIMGLHCLVTGAFLKSVAADNIGQGIDPVWAGQAAFQLSAGDRWLVAFLYYCQIYADFAGYSLMAIGMARMLGYKFPANFRTPMRASSLQDFWRRWHITLSRWLRDYLYIPLGGSRRGSVSVNLLVTMVLGGLWHGAGWGFVVWGAWHGIGLVLERKFQVLRAAPFAGWIVTQLWVTIAWIFFRSQSLGDAVAYIRGMFAVKSWGDLGVHAELAYLLAFAAIPVLHHFAPLLIRYSGRSRLGPTLGALTGLMLCLCIIIASPNNTFIYFKF